MRAKPGDAKVCSRCMGTGTFLFKLGRYTYSLPCHVPVNSAQPELPQEKPEPEEKVENAA